MRLSPLIIGVMFVIIGIAWVSFIFNETEKASSAMLLEPSKSLQTQLQFYGQGTGYYNMYIPNFSGEEIFVQVLDTNENVISEQKVQTKLSVGYFDFEKDGTYTIRATNISKEMVHLQTEFGDTNAQEMFAPGIMIVIGALTIMIITYFKIKNYSIEQPEENIS